mgnify:CR=1 FL=1
MSAIVQLSRGDINKLNSKNLKNGQLFWSYVNNNPTLSNNHTYSKGQLWIKDPSSDNLIEISNRRGNEAMKFQGYIDLNFNGDFINADEYTQQKFRHCHIGDFWIFKVSKYEGFTETFLKGDILLVVDTVYEKSDETTFKENLKSVTYIKIPGSTLTTEDSDLEATAISEAVVELQQRLLYQGEIESSVDFFNKPKKKGHLYVFTKQLQFTTAQLIGPDFRYTETGLLQVKYGDLTFFNGENWILIPSGQDAADVFYESPELELDFEGDDVETTIQSLGNVKETLDFLINKKAQLGSDGKILYNQLPESVKSGLFIQGVFNPIIDTAVDKNLETNQNNWPTSKNLHTGFFWIVDCADLQNVQYVDKTKNSRVVELNTGDWIVWIEDKDQFDVVDNSERLTEILVQVATDVQKRLSGSVGLATTGKIKLSILGNTILLSGESLLSQLNEFGKKNYLPMYGDTENNLINSSIHQDKDVVIVDVDFQTGSIENTRKNQTFGDVVISKTTSSSTTGFENHGITFESILQNNLQTVERTTRLLPSVLSSRLKTDQVIDDVSVFLPEVTSTLLGVLGVNELSKNYLPKSFESGIVTDSLISEIFDINNTLLNSESEQGLVNIGLGRLATEDLDTGEVTFYAKSKNRTNDVLGFYTQLHTLLVDSKNTKDYIEHLLDLNKITSKTTVRQNELVTKNARNISVFLPSNSGILTTREEVLSTYSDYGEFLTIPFWNYQLFEDEVTLGFVSSPISVKVNRAKKGIEQDDLKNDLSQNYGPDKKTTWSYINAQNHTTVQNYNFGILDSSLFVDAWFEVKRNITSFESFSLPVTTLKDKNKKINTNTLETLENVEDELYQDFNKEDGFFQQILPSKTIYKDNVNYFDPFTGESIKQVVDKDVEMPATGGVLLTSTSILDGGFW